MFAVRSHAPVTPQVPIKLVVFHLSVLAFLERFKNKIGELQHAFLTRACAALGLTRFLLPLPRVDRQHLRTARPLDLDGDGVNGDAINVDELADDDDALVGPPLQRPPPGWDDLAGAGPQGLGRRAPLAPRAGPGAKEATP